MFSFLPFAFVVPLTIPAASLADGHSYSSRSDSETGVLTVVLAPLNSGEEGKYLESDFLSFKKTADPRSPTLFGW